MRLLIITIFICATNAAFSQGRVSGTTNIGAELGGNHYPTYSWQANYRFTIEDKRLLVYLSNGSVSLQPGSDYIYAGERFTKADLGLSAWPGGDQTPYGMVVKLSVTVNGKHYQVSATNNGQHGDYIASLSDIGNVNFNAIGVSVIGMMFNPKSDNVVDGLIAAKRNNKNAATQISTPTTRNAGFTTATPATSAARPAAANTPSPYSSPPASPQAAAVDPNKYLLNSPTGLTSEQAINNLGNFISNMAARNRQEREEKEAREAARAQRAEEARIAELNRKAALRSSREYVTSALKPAKIPLSSEKVAATELYYFACLFYPQQFEDASPYLAVSNVFPIAKYADSTWPFQTTVTAELSKANNGRAPILIGYYFDRKEAETVLNSYLSAWREAGFAVNQFNYKGKKSSGSVDADFWGTATNKAPAAAATTGDKKTDDDDFWGTGKITPAKNYIEAAPADKKDSNSQETDFWGNPVNKTSTKADSTAVKKRAGSPDQSH